MPWLVVLTFTAMVAVNGLANALPINGVTTGGVSDSLPSLFTPAGYTFAIWGLIYLALLFYVVYQALPANRDDTELRRIGAFFSLSCFANSLWIIAWHYQQLWLSMALMLVILGSLSACYLQLRAATPPQTLRYLCLHLPFSLYLGWITVATLANVSAIQSGMGWNDAGLSPEVWTLLKLAVACAIAVLMTLRFGDPVYVLVIAWAALGISQNGAGGAVGTVASALTGLCLLLAVVGFRRGQRLTP